jgi:hypothetical protein
MAAREASIKVTLLPQSFQSGLRRMENMTKSAGKRMGAALRGPMTAGLKSARTELGGMMSTLKNGVKTVATLGGALAFTGLAKDALQMQNTYKNIAFNVNKVAGNAVEWNDIQQMIADSVQKTGRNADDLSTAFMTVFEATGSMEFAKKSMDIIGTTATATGHSIDALATTMQLASRKFGVGPDEMEEAMTRMIEKTGVGGKGIEELSSRFALVAGEAANAGFKGAEGISELLGVLLLLDSTIGEKADPGLKLMFQTLKGGSAQFIRLKKDMGSGVTFTADMTAMDKMKAILSSTKGRKSAEQVFTADARVVYDELAIPFDEAMEKAKARGLSQADAVKAGMEAFDANLAEASKSTMKYSEIQAEAAERVKSDPLVKFNLALARVKEAMVQPSMIAAFDKLADKLPAFADALASIITKVVDNPWGSLAAIVGGKLALAFGGSMIAEVAAKGMAAMFAQTLAVQGASGAASIATRGATTLGVGGAVRAAAGGGAGLAGLAGAAASAAAALTLAAAAGVAVGTGFRWLTGMDDVAQESFRAVEDAGLTVETAMRVSDKPGASRGEKQGALLDVEIAQKQLEDTASTFDDAVSFLVEGWAGATGGDMKLTTGQKRDRASDALEAEAKILKGQLAEAEANDKVTAAANKLAASLAVVTSYTKKMGKDTSRGVAPPPTSTPGADSKAG